MRREKMSLDEGIDMRTLLFFPGGLELHIGMFIPSILSQGTPEQQAKWLPLCNRLQVVGTYAQTELGHGTFVRGLETVAAYDPAAREFVVHSPTLTATKWWPGGLGKTATHVILMARLVLGGRDHGPHAFVVQIRDMDSHRPVVGVEVGDIGPKMGYNGVDNGWLRFDHLRIPRDAMLMRFARVTEEGAYVPPPPANVKASYATMVYVRATVSGGWVGLVGSWSSGERVGGSRAQLRSVRRADPRRRRRAPRPRRSCATRATSWAAPSPSPPATPRSAARPRPRRASASCRSWTTTTCSRRWCRWWPRPSRSSSWAPG
jgi:hypothetical protein